jgi:NAD(P)-dependent dehydrogenase (short-subunit alcohol dehydrogenase family)
VVAEIERGGGTAAYRLTALDGAAAARDLAAWAAEAGDGHVDILVNNVGVAPAGPTESATEAEFDQAFTINVKVPFFLVASLAPAMAARGQGAIVLVHHGAEDIEDQGVNIIGTDHAPIVPPALPASTLPLELPK